MAVAQGLKTVTVTINDTEVSVPEGELIVESVKRLGLEIPVFCYHPRMKPVGMCRMCLVDVGFKQPDGSVRMMPKPQAGCTLPASDNMVVYTDSENVHRDRKGVLEFLLVNHPLDCPICDRGGECPLQNNTLAYGPSTSRFIELKRHLPKAFPLSQYVTLDLERCIQCGRCVRFTEEISGEHELAFRFRGAQMQPSTFQLTNFESKFSGNVIEICPVGALTNAKYRFRARPWDLEASPGVCTECSNGCNVWFDHRAGRFVRINGRVNEAVNEEWTCDKGKFGHEYYNSEERLTTPYMRTNDGFVPCGWAEAYESIAKGFERPSSEIAGLTGPRVANEGLFMFNRMMADGFGSDHVTAKWSDSAVDAVNPTTIASLETLKGVLVFATDMATDLPIVYLRLRKAAVNNGLNVVVVNPAATETDAFATSVHHTHGSSLGDAAKDVAQGRHGGDALGPGWAVIVSDSILNLPGGDEAAKALEAAATSKGAAFNLLATGANAMGAQVLGLSRGRTAPETLRATSRGDVRSLWIVESDPTTTEVGVTALEEAEFVVVQGTTWNGACEYANVILPMAAPMEQEGTWTNCESRVQRVAQAIRPPGEAKPAWRIFSEMLLRLKPTTPFFNSGEVLDEVVRTVPAFAGVSAGIAEEGTVLTASPVPVASGGGD